MRRTALIEEITRLDAAQTKRHRSYTVGLATNRDKRLYDKQVSTLVEDYCILEKADEVRSYLYEIGFTRSKYEYDKMEAQMERFTEDNHRDFRWNKHYQKAKEELIKEFRSYRLKPLQYQTDKDIEDVLPKKGTHAGFDYILTGKMKKADYLEPGVLTNYFTEESRAREAGTFRNIIMAGTRTQASGAFDHDNDYAFTNTFKAKTRLVSMVRIWLILAECKFARPLQRRIGLSNWYAGGKNDADISSLLFTNRTKYNYSLTLDYSHYDQSISDWLIRDCFDIMKEGFIQEGFDDELFAIVREDLIHKYFLDGSGNSLESHKGVCSGSMFTQLVDSIVNKLMILTYKYAKDISRMDFIIMGDDNIIFTEREIVRADICTYLKYNFGIEAHPDKCSGCTTYEDPEFLSRIWTYAGVWRHPYELLAKLLYPESFRNYQKGADEVMILYAYILSFPSGMRQLIDVDRFMATKRPQKEMLKDEKKRRYLNGLMKQRLTFR